MKELRANKSTQEPRPIPFLSLTDDGVDVGELDGVDVAVFSQDKVAKYNKVSMNWSILFDTKITDTSQGFSLHSITHRSRRRSRCGRRSACWRARGSLPARKRSKVTSE